MSALQVYVYSALLLIWAAENEDMQLYTQDTYIVVSNGAFTGKLQPLKSWHLHKEDIIARNIKSNADILMMT